MSIRNVLIFKLLLESLKLVLEIFTFIDTLVNAPQVENYSKCSDGVWITFSLCNIEKRVEQLLLVAPIFYWRRKMEFIEWIPQKTNYLRINLLFFFFFLFLKEKSQTWYLTADKMAQLKCFTEENVGFRVILYYFLLNWKFSVYLISSFLISIGPSIKL